MSTKQEILEGHYTCTCDEMYKSRGIYDPACVLHTEGGEIELIMDEWAKQVAIAFAIHYNRNVDDRMEVRYRIFLEEQQKT